MFDEKFLEKYPVEVAGIISGDIIGNVYWNLEMDSKHADKMKGHEHLGTHFDRAKRIAEKYSMVHIQRGEDSLKAFAEGICVANAWVNKQSYNCYRDEKERDFRLFSHTTDKINDYNQKLYRMTLGTGNARELQTLKVIAESYKFIVDESKRIDKKWPVGKL